MLHVEDATLRAPGRIDTYARKHLGLTVAAPGQQKVRRMRAMRWWRRRGLVGRLCGLSGLLTRWLRLTVRDWFLREKSRRDGRRYGTACSSEWAAESADIF